MPSPITYAELLALKSIRTKLQSLDAAVFDDPADRTKLLDKIARKIGGAIEWRTAPQALAVQAAVQGGGVFAGLITAARDRAAVEQTVDALTAGLGAPYYYDREQAQQELNGLIGLYLFKGDFSRATIALDRMIQFARNSQNPEIEFRTVEVVGFARKAVRFLTEKQQEILRVTGGT